MPRNYQSNGNRLEADRERKNRKHAEELPEQRRSRLAAKRESEKRRRAEELLEQQQEIRLAADRESEEKKACRGITRTAGKSGLLLIEKVRKESVPRNQSNLKVIAWHSGTTQSMIIA